MPRLFITAGHSHQDPGAKANGLVEALLTIDLRNLVTTQCQKLGATVINDDDNQNLKQVIAKIKTQSKPDDFILDIHFNSAVSTAKGVEAFVATNATEQEKQVAAALCSVVSKTIGSPNRGVKPESQSQHNTLGILRPDGINILLEIAFISNKKEIASYLQVKQQVATGVAHALLPIHAPVRELIAG